MPPFYPPLLAAYPIVSLYGRNVHQVLASELAGPVAAAVAGGLAVWLVFGLILRTAAKGAVVSAAAILLFYSIEPAAGWTSAFLTWASQVWVCRQVDAGPWWVVGPEILLLAATIAWCVRGAGGLAAATRWLNAVATITMFLAVLPIVEAGVSTGRSDRGIDPATARSPDEPPGDWHPTPLATLNLPPGSPLPDIYYIILDGYARDDVMRSHFDLDISPFLDHIESRGFYVARQSPANYCQTPLCLSSSLNGVYLDEMVKNLQTDQTMLREFIGRNNVLATLRPLGYRWVTFATGFDPVDHPEADRYFTPTPYWSEFYRMALGLTPLYRLAGDPSRRNTLTASRARINYVFDHLPDIARDPAPTFTYAHIICPHPPMIFGPNGEDVSQTIDRRLLYANKAIAEPVPPEVFRRAYRDQAAYITKRVGQAIDAILDASPEPPIIIVQSDHGSELNLDPTSSRQTDLHERMSILNAYHFPGRRYDSLHEGISPVNSFRAVFNTFFGARLPMLPDRSYFSTGMSPYVFEDVTEAAGLDSRSPEGS